ncbi:HAMP domain-containing sensor histidine kinase [Planotetraspora phitsanulokensis]|uniref:histidine kinase n=1 Tax=Planotetraspora phitsanulokensis TaxID=575192 RepID=A0A8J3TYV7_9ACTN|nr:HAMP domain-containing sensor histidine kinase [Planotetraspora phitsanulokensis]GII35111.1 two-component sensor histidine kinase [Planotetraspora phitsanulokensis]
MRFENYSIRARLALFTGTAVGALCIVFSIVLLFAINRMATQNLAKEVTAVGELTAYYVDRGELVNPLPPIPHNLIRPVQVVDPRGQVVAATNDLQNRPPMAHFRPKSPGRVASGVVCDSVFPSGGCHIVVAQQVYRDGDWTIYSAAPTLPFFVYPGVAALLIVGTAVFTVAVAYGARHTVTRSLQPVDAIRAQLDHIRSTNLSRRVPIPTARDEIHRLARSVNETLNRLESMLEQQRRFCSDASHELRTPITAIRTQIEDALLAPEDVDLNRLCDDILPSVERLQSITADLLTLTRFDADEPSELRAVDLAELVAVELNSHQMSRKVVRRLTPDVIVRGDRAQLRQLICNLLQNAQRYASSTVTVTLRHGGGDPRSAAAMVELEVLDDGTGIAADQRETVFLRFTRLDTARSRDAGGIGLGLPIARQIAERHGGTLTIQDSDRGARFVVRLPVDS